MVCPKCGPGAAVMSDECIDVEEYDDDNIAVTYEGTCLWCKRKYQWTEIYKYSCIKNIIEIGTAPQEEEEN